MQEVLSESEWRHADSSVDLQSYMPHPVRSLGYIQMRGIVRHKRTYHFRPFKQTELTGVENILHTYIKSLFRRIKAIQVKMIQRSVGRGILVDNRE